MDVVQGRRSKRARPTSSRATAAAAASSARATSTLELRSEVLLRDGSTVEIRPLRADDKAGLAAGFARLSELSRYRRFLSPTTRLTHGQLAYLTELDHHDHEALVAVDPASRHGLGVARYVRSRDDPREAEFAVAVADDWQRRGLGTALLRALAARAREEGIRRFTGLVGAENRSIRALLQTLGPFEQRPGGGGAIEVSLEVPEESGSGEHLRKLAGWMRAAATGQLNSRLGGRGGS
jgi:GNAT superfamily N-acetyltransferase